MSHPLLAALRSDDPAARAAACRAIADDPAGALLVEGLVDGLGDRERTVARAAGEALLALARRSDGVAPLLRAGLRVAQPGAATGDPVAGRAGRARRIRAALLLARLEPPGPGLLPALVDGLGARDGDVRWAAARVLVDMGRLHPEIVGVMIGLVRSAGDPSARRMASFALRELAPDLPQAAAALLSATEDEDRDVRHAAVTALAGLLDPPATVVARLAELCGDPDETLARLASLAHARIEAAGGTEAEG